MFLVKNLFHKSFIYSIKFDPFLNLMYFKYVSCVLKSSVLNHLLPRPCLFTPVPSVFSRNISRLYISLGSDLAQWWGGVSWSDADVKYCDVSRPRARRPVWFHRSELVGVVWQPSRLLCEVCALSALLPCGCLCQSLSSSSGQAAAGFVVELKRRRRAKCGPVLRLVSLPTHFFETRPCREFLWSRPEKGFIFNDVNYRQTDRDVNDFSPLSVDSAFFAIQLCKTSHYQYRSYLVVFSDSTVWK